MAPSVPGRRRRSGTSAMAENSTRSWPPPRPGNRPARGGCRPGPSAALAAALQQAPRRSERDVHCHQSPDAARGRRGRIRTATPGDARLRPEPGLHRGLAEPDRADPAGRRVRVLVETWLERVVGDLERAAGTGGAEDQLRYRAGG